MSLPVIILAAEAVPAPTASAVTTQAYTALSRAADAQGISVSQYVREAALVRVVLDELESDHPEGVIASGHDLLAIAREVRRLASVES